MVGEIQLNHLKSPQISKQVTSEWLWVAPREKNIKVNMNIHSSNRSQPTTE